MTLLYKAIQAELKALDEKGQGQAVIVTLNTVDHDQDVTEPGAFGGEQWVKMVPAHDWAHAPIGKAKLHEVRGEVLADFQMNLNMASAKEWYEALRFDLKNPPALQEWSYGFRILDSGFGEFEGKRVRLIKKLKAIEISPVMVGAGVNTRTLALKHENGGRPDESLNLEQPLSPNRVVPFHQVDTDDRLWDAILQQRRVKGGQAAGYYRQIYGLLTPHGDPEVKSHWQFIHHLVHEDGTPGAANLTACLAIIASLKGWYGMQCVTEDERKGVYAHMAAHLRDGGREVPELLASDSGITLHDELELVLSYIEPVLNRADRIEDIHTRKGKTLPQVIIDKIVLLQRKMEHFGSMQSRSQTAQEEITAHEETELMARRVETRRAEEAAKEQEAFQAQAKADAERVQALLRRIRA